jgi:hypothetical protein
LSITVLRPERGFVELLEKRPAAGAPAAHHAIVQLIEEAADCSVEFGQREEAPMPQPCQDPAPDDLNANLDPRFREGRLLALSRGL